MEKYDNDVTLHKEIQRIKELEANGKYHEAKNIIDKLKALTVKDYPELVELETRILYAIDTAQYITKEEQNLYIGYCNWMRSLGTNLDKLELHYFSKNYRGIMATADFSEGDTVLLVPRKAIITLRMAKDSPIGKKIADSGTHLIYPNNSLLSIFVLQEKVNPKSSWQWLIKGFPSETKNFPIFFNSKECALLEGSPFLRQVEELKEDMAKDYRKICKAAPEFQKYATLQEFMKTRALVNSRIFGTTIDNEENDSIVPFADMFNFKHRSDMTHWKYSVEQDGFAVKAKRDIKRGEEIYVYYGNKPNTSFFQFYGFVLEKNNKNDATVEVSLLDSDPLLKIKKDLLEQPLETKKFKITLHHESPSCANFLSFARYIVFEGTEDQLKTIKEASKILRNTQEAVNVFNATYITPISRANEEKALNYILTVCSNTLKQYPTTYEEDIEKLRNTSLTMNARNCILFVAGEKRVLRNFIKITQSALAIFNMTESKEIEKACEENYIIKSYIASIHHILQQCIHSIFYTNLINIIDYKTKLCSL